MICIASTIYYGYKYIQSLEFNDFPIQKWLHFVIVLDNRNVDVFMNGELKKSMVLESPPALEEDAELVFNSNGGFDGKVSNAKVFNYGVLPIGRCLCF